MSMLTENRYTKGTDLSALSSPESFQKGTHKEPIKVIFSDKYWGPSIKDKG